MKLAGRGYEEPGSKRARDDMPQVYRFSQPSSTPRRLLRALALLRTALLAAALGTARLRTSLVSACHLPLLDLQLVAYVFAARDAFSHIFRHTFGLALVHGSSEDNLALPHLHFDLGGI